MVFAAFTACKKSGSELQYGYSKIFMPQAVAQSGLTNNNYNVPMGTDSTTFNYILDPANNKIMVKLGAAVSGNTTDGFTVNVNVKNDTIQTLLANGTLDATSMVMPASMYTIPSQVQVPKGKINSPFYLTLDANQLKSSAYAGKKLCLWVNISNPTNYTLDSSESGTLIILNVNDMLNTFQRIYMPQATSTYVVPTGANAATYNYSVDNVNNKVNIKLGVATGVTINGVLKQLVNSKAYSVNISANNDTIAKMMANGTLDPSKNILMPATMYTLPSMLNVPAGLSTVDTFNLSVDIAQLKSPAYRDKNLVLAVQLSNPTGYDINPGLTTALVSISINDLVMGPPTDVSATYLTNNTSPFKAAGLQPGQSRWGTLAGWTANSSILSHGGYGGYGSDGDGQLIDLEAGWGSAAIPNGKLYQTVMLPAGTYSLNVTWVWASILWAPNSGNGSAYVVANPGTSLPDYNNIENNSNTFYYKMASSMAKGATQKVVFAITQPTQVSLGLVVNYPGTSSGQGFKISSMTLSNYPKSL